MRRVSASPRPVPAERPSCGPRWNSSKISSSSPSGMPTPWSTTSTRIQPGSSSGSELICTQGCWSAAVYLIALPTRLSRSWRSRPGVGVHAVVEVEDELRLVVAGPAGPAAVDDLAGDAVQLDRLGAQLAVLDDGVVQPVLDHLAHAPAGLAGLAHGVVDERGVLDGVAVLDDLEPAVEHGQRPAQVVGHHAGEVAQLAQARPLGGDVVQQHHRRSLVGGADRLGGEVQDA